MKTSRKALVAGSLLLASGMAAAADSSLSANVGLTSDYRFRGVSQSAKDPALQGGVDYTHPSGFYLGTWASTIDFDAGPGLNPDADFELDLYGGYKWKMSGIEWDAGFIHYAYPGSKSSFDLPFTELYFGGTYGPVNAKIFYTDDYTGPTSKSATYLTVGLTQELGSGFTLGASVGRSSGGGIKDTFGDDYTDFKIGVSKDFFGVTFNLSYVDTSGISPDIKTDVFNTEGTVVLTATKTF
ncbi:MAG: TorF family putative porin [Sulfurifustis sp.]